MIKREMSSTLKKVAKEYPVVLVHGPRQSGKTTICRAVFSDKPYVSMENPDTRSRALEDPRGFLADFPNGVILDEIQRTPNLLSYMQQIVDEKKQNGFFILTGSDNFSLQQITSQSLAGRIALLTLLPFSMKEIKSETWLTGTDKRILYGGYPRLITEMPDRTFFFKNYIGSYIERDVRQIVNVKDSNLFHRFLTLCAGRIGSILDYTSLSNDCGISVKTVKEWLSILESSYICFLLNPWYVNRNKRLIKSPKLYFYDTGVACSLLGIYEEAQLNRDPLRGNLFENLVILEKIKQAFNTTKPSNFWYYRTSSGIEVDLVEENGRTLIPTEIKSAASFNSSFCKNLTVFKSEYPEESAGENIVYAGSENFTYKGIRVCNFELSDEV
jgi:predicted AAA+ superfamily ATPase